MSSHRRREQKAYRKSLVTCQKVLSELMNYSAHLDSLLRETQEQQLLKYHAYEELRIQQDPSLYIFDSIPIPPPIQALVLEEYRLRKEVDYMCRQGDVLYSKEQSLFAKIVIVNVLAGRWNNQQQQKQSKKWILNQYKKVETHIGNNWKLLFVEDIKIFLPRLSKPK